MSINILKGVVSLTITSNIKWKSLLINLLIPLSVGGIAALITNGSFENYENTVKPVLSPPSWLFPIVWTILYILMGISVYLIYEKDKNVNRKPFILYAVQLMLNFIWPIFFFGFEAYLFAFIILLTLIIFVVAMTITFYKESKLAGILQLPYVFWLLFAAYLNLSVYIMN